MVSRGFTHTPGGDLASVTRPGAPTLAYSYDARGRLSSVMSGAAQIASYAYDWREQRVAASSTEVGSRHYLYAEDGQLLAEHDAQTGALIREFVWLDTMPLAMVTGPAATPSYTWITTGNLNEPLLLTNAAGQVTASTTRDPWGNPILLAGGTPLNLGYPGQWRDPATGLFQNWHRDYDPTLGRYIEADPLGLGGGSNLFAYVGGDPVNMVDPTGLLCEYAAGDTNARIQCQRVDPHNDPKVLHVFGHANPSCMSFFGKCLDGREFHQEFSRHRRFDRVRSVLLWGCNAGRGNENVAQDIANRLHLPVVAFDRWTWWNDGFRGSFGRHPTPIERREDLGGKEIHPMPWGYPLHHGEKDTSDRGRHRVFLPN